MKEVVGRRKRLYILSFLPRVTAQRESENSEGEELDYFELQLKNSDVVTCVFYFGGHIRGSYKSALEGSQRGLCKRHFYAFDLKGYFCKGYTPLLTGILSLLKGIYALLKDVDPSLGETHFFYHTLVWSKYCISSIHKYTNIS